MIGITQKGNWSKTRKWLEAVERMNVTGVLDKYGQLGVEALSQATPVDTGLAASSWNYEIKKENGNIIIQWNNTDIEGGYNVAILLQYGHGTNRGVFVRGIDYINPAMRPVMDSLANELWKEVI